jgi:hypothetical protein
MYVVCHFLAFLYLPPESRPWVYHIKKSGAKVHAHTFAPLSYIFLEIVFCGHLQTLSHAVHDAVGGHL